MTPAILKASPVINFIYLTTGLSLLIIESVRYTQLAAHKPDITMQVMTTIAVRNKVSMLVLSHIHCFLNCSTTEIPIVSITNKIIKFAQSINVSLYSP